MSQTAAQFLPLVALIAIMYFLMIRPQRKKDKAINEMRRSLTVGDEIVTSHLSDIYPAGLAIGKVLELETDTNGLTKYAVIQPYVDLKHLDTILVIDKKKMKLKDAGFPAIVLEQTPKYLRGSKVPVVKAKIGPKVMSLMCEPKIFDLIPVKKEVKAVMNGIYIIDVKGMRGGLAEKPEKLSL